MKRATLAVLTFTFVVGMAMSAWADVPAPPVNQLLGFDDVAFSAVTAADCRACHEGNPDVPVQGNCLQADGVTGSNQTCIVDADCTVDPVNETCTFGVENRHHLLYYSLVPSISVVPYPQFNTVDGRYTCLSCHDEVFTLERDCTVCHDGASPHHTTAAADAALCTTCHGDIVDDSSIAGVGDGHYIPTYAPSLVTPEPSRGNANLQTNGRSKCSTDQLPCTVDADCAVTTPLQTCDDVAAGACNYCHDYDVMPDPVILSNRDLHHGINLIDFGNRCFWCHQSDSPPQDAYDIRTCEGCHGPDSLHNIQADSNGDNIIEVGGELAGFGHVGRDAGPSDSDCWGCHGFQNVPSGAAPGSGPVIPSVSGSDVNIIGAGSTVSVGGAAFTNIDGAVSYSSEVSLTGADGSTVILTPDSISEGTITVTIPGDTAPGNYDLQAVKAESASNSVVVSIAPVAVVTDLSCSGNVATISGSGFSGYQEGSGTEVTGTVVTGKGKNRITTTETGAVSSWSDTQIVAAFSDCPRDVAVTTVFASDGGGDPPAASCSDITDDQTCIDDPNCDLSCNKKGRCSCIDSDGGTDPPTGSCSDKTDQASCDAAGCNWNSKKSVCR